MAEKLSEYLVQEILANGNYGETCYKVKHKQTKSILVWKAYDCKTHTTEQLNIIANEMESIKLLDDDNLIKYYEVIIYSPSHTLYIVTELYPKNRMTELVEKCKTDHILFDEPFIWRCLYQIASAVKNLSRLNINVLQKHINIENLYVSDQFNIKLDAFNLNSVPKKISCGGDVCKIGEILFEMCMSNKYSPELKDVKFKHSEDLQNMINILVHNGEKQNGFCLLKPDIILHHPTVLINLQSKVKQIFKTDLVNAAATLLNNDSAFESDESIHKSNVTLRRSLSTDDISNIISTPKNIRSCQTPDILECKSIPTASYRETYIGNDLSPTLVALDLKIPGYVPRKESDHVKKWRSRLELCREPQEVCEQALNQVWMKRMAELREREEVLKQKELEITKEKNKYNKRDEINCNKDFDDICNSMSGITLQPSLVQKVFKDDGILSNHLKDDKVTDRRRSNRQSLSDGSVASDKSRTSMGRSRHRRSNSAKTKYRKRKTMNYEDLNSSLSADPGDASMIQTSNKISSDRVPRPKSIHNVSRRKVHFNNKNNPFAEYDTVSSTVLTFFDIEDMNASYLVPMTPPPGKSLADRIAKFTYLDLERMTNEKRAQLEEIRKTPPKVNRATKPTLKSKIKAAENLKKFAPTPEETTTNNNRIYFNDLDLQKNIVDNEANRPASSLSKASGCSSRSANSRRSLSSISSTNRDDRKGNTPPFVTVCRDERRKPIIMDIDIEDELNILEENKENTATPAPKLNKKDNKRKSILGFKAPFKFRL